MGVAWFDCASPPLGSGEIFPGNLPAPVRQACDADRRSEMIRLLKNYRFFQIVILSAAKNLVMEISSSVAFRITLNKFSEPCSLPLDGGGLGWVVTKSL
jgi:hypothetical protein